MSQSPSPAPPQALGAAALQATAWAWLAQGRPAWVVEVLRTQGSAPREAGARLLVSLEASAGTLGGGHLEHRALQRARAALQQGVEQLDDERHALGPSLGQCCGGVVWLRYQALHRHPPAHWPVAPPRFVLELYGAGHVGRAVVQALAPLPCQVRWLDARADAFPTAPLPAHVEALCVAHDAELLHEVTAAPAGAHVLVVTHRHDLDLQLVQVALRRPELPWVGLIGSATKRARFVHRLQDQGLGEADLARLHCPVGLPGLTGKDPAVIAVAVAAQLLQRNPDAAASTPSTTAPQSIELSHGHL